MSSRESQVSPTRVRRLSHLLRTPSRWPRLGVVGSARGHYLAVQGLSRRLLRKDVPGRKTMGQVLIQAAVDAVGRASK